MSSPQKGNDQQQQQQQPQQQSLAPPAQQTGRVSPSGRISPAAGRLSPAGRASPNPLDPVAGGPAPVPAAAAAQRSSTNDKLIRILTVIAYLCSVSGAAFMLSLYYIFLWDPAGHGHSDGKPAAFQAGDGHEFAAAGPVVETTTSASSLANVTVSGSPIMRAIANLSEKLVESASSSANKT